MKKLLLIIPLLSYLFNQTVEIQSGAFQENFYLQGEAVYFNVHVKNTGSMTLSDLWLNVDISDPNSTNVIEGLWQYLPTLNPNETYETGYDYIWTVSAGATLGNYYAAISLRDISNVYDIEYGIDNFNIIESEEPFPLSEGKIVFHSYSDYEAWDGKLFLYDFSEQLLTEISQGWDIDHTINAHFSPDGSKIVFMGTPSGNHNSSSWDIYLWDLFSDMPINLTANNGLRDEDPKFSPNGNEIVFKQDGDLKVMDLINNTIIHTTNNGYSIEESMPYYTSDSQYIIYARGAGISSDIYIINKDGMENQPLENITNIQEYYPIIRSNSTFLYTRWVSAENHHDQIYLGYFSDTNTQSLFFNDESADDSDPFPVNSEYVLFSSNRSGGQGGWDLYLADINSSTTWSMDEFNLNSSIHELGICYFSGASINGCTDPEACNYDPEATGDDGSCTYEVDCAGVCGGDNTSCQQLGDINGDGIINVIDIVMAVDLILNGNYDVVADVNEDGYLDVLDVVMLVNWVLNGEPSLCDGLTEVELWGEYYDIATTTEIDLWGMELGSIPPEIGCLTNLAYLFLSNNQLTGEIPSSIGNLTNLVLLYLHFNQLSGEIPQEVCDLLESNNLNINNILTGNNLINTCD